MTFESVMRKMMIVAIILGTAVPINQIYKMIKNKSDTNVPLWGYSLYLLVCIIWILYGFSKRDYLIMASSTVNITLAIIILILARYYKNLSTEV